MNDETRLAFAHPLERAKASSISTQYDRISLRDHIVEVEIGAFQLERGVTQRVSFNIVVEVQPIEQPILDDVDRILSYDRLTEAIAIELGAERLNLLETLAQRIADRILLEPQAIRVFIRIEKLDRGPGALGVEISVDTFRVHLQDFYAAIHRNDKVNRQNPLLQPFYNGSYIACRALPRKVFSASDPGPLILCPSDIALEE